MASIHSFAVNHSNQRITKPGFFVADGGGSACAVVYRYRVSSFRLIGQFCLVTQTLDSASPRIGHGVFRGRCWAAAISYAGDQRFRRTPVPGLQRDAPLSGVSSAIPQRASIASCRGFDDGMNTNERGR
jgi:hypothetical protein